MRRRLPKTFFGLASSGMSTADFYRAEAERLAARARVADDDAARHTLLAMAEEYRVLAEEMERHKNWQHNPGTR